MWPDKVLEFHVADFEENGWGKVYLSSHPNDGNNQKWMIHPDSNSIESEHDNRGLRLDVHRGSTENGAEVGCYLPNNTPAQKWTISQYIVIHITVAISFLQYVRSCLGNIFFSHHHMG